MLKKALEDARNINDENTRIASQYGGEFSFVKSYQDAVIEAQIDKSVIESFLKIVYDRIKDTMNTDSMIIQGKTNFIASIKKDITKILVKEGIYKSVKPVYDQMLADLYTNVQIYRTDKEA